MSRYDWAIINAGGQLAVRAAVASLLERGLLSRTPDGRGLTANRIKLSGHPLEQEILAAATDGPRMDRLVSQLSRGPAVRAALLSLAADGYALSPARQRLNFARRCAPTLAFLIAAVLILIAGHNGSAVIACVIGAAFAGLLLIRWPGRSPATRLGRSALQERQSRGRQQERRGRLDAGAAVALFGVRSLWALNPALAQQMDVPRTDWSTTDGAFTPGALGRVSHGNLSWASRAEDAGRHVAFGSGARRQDAGSR